jgi:hypothetical protein
MRAGRSGVLHDVHNFRLTRHASTIGGPRQIEPAQATSGAGCLLSGSGPAGAWRRAKVFVEIERRGSHLPATAAGARLPPELFLQACRPVHYHVDGVG